MREISRRDFVALSAAGAAAPLILERGLAWAAGTVTAQQIVDRIKANIGVEWGSDDVDTFKAGDPSTVVTGVVTTSMATLDVLQKAVAANANFIITAAPTFYSRVDASTPAGRGGAAGAARGGPPARGQGAGAAARGGRGQGAAPAAAPPPSPATVSGPGTGASAPMPPTPPLPQSVVPPAPPGGRGAAAPAAPDPVYAGKNAFIEKHKLVIYRLTQHWNQRTPDPRAQGLAAAMGWPRPRQGDLVHFDVTPVTLEALARQLKKALQTRGGIRAIGDRSMTVRRVGLLPGYSLIEASIAMLPTVDVIVTGEVQEWESATYAQDVAFAGVKKGLISIGRVVNEAPGMQVCADWLRPIVPEVPTRFIPAGDPYWRPL
jgi:putative NIF3 family GTP cyclohydrolase 1 type 2